MNIKNRIWSLPVISAVIFGLGLAVSSYITSSALDTIERTGAVDYPALSQASVLQADVTAITEELKNAVLEGDKKRLVTVDEAAGKLIARLRQFGSIPGQQEAAARLSTEFNTYYRDASGATRIMLEVDQGDADAAIGKMQRSLDVLTKSLQGTVNHGKAQFTAGIAHSSSQVYRVLVISIAVALAVLMTLAGVSYFVVRAIWQQLGGEPEYARSIARTVAAGDLSIAIAFDPAQPDSLLAALAEMKTRLEGIVSGIKTAAEEIRVASGEIASGNADLSERTETQASNLGQAAQSMSEMTGMVEQNAASARHATDLARVAAGVATRGGHAVGQVVETMSGISSSARKIADIISVIDGIAFQTNILALNAAVEAARAGEQGRGFAVVASEVRNLAQRSAGAAKEIKVLINESVAQVDTGSTLVATAGRTMGEIVASVEQVSRLIEDISNSSADQSVGLKHLSTTVNEMDSSTQRNAAMTEQAAAAASSLQEQAMQMSHAVGIFKLSGAPTQRQVSLRPAGGKAASRLALK